MQFFLLPAGFHFVAGGDICFRCVIVYPVCPDILPYIRYDIRDRRLKSFYAPADCSHLSYDQNLGDPGKYPFTRGIYPEMYRDRLWLKSFIVSYSTPEETNAAFKQ